MTFKDYLDNGTFKDKDITDFVRAKTTCDFINEFFSSEKFDDFLLYALDYQKKSGKQISTKSYDNSVKEEPIERPTKLEKWLQTGTVVEKQKKEKLFTEFVNSYSVGKFMDKFFNNRQFYEAMGFAKHETELRFKKYKEEKKKNEVTVPGNVKIHFKGIYSRIEKNKQGDYVLYKFDPRDSVDNVLNNVEIIGAGAFLGVNIEMIRLPSHIKVICGNAFNASLNKIIIPENSRLKIIRAYAFRNTEIREIILPASLEEIGEGAFAGCDKLTRISFQGAKSKIRFGVAKEAFKDVPNEDRINARVEKIIQQLETKSVGRDTGGVTQ